jgi:L-threonylcarbamoyladenylate synthase
MDKECFDSAVRALETGDVVVYPTDTLYALGADIGNDAAVRKIFQLKQRPLSAPLPVAVANVNEIDEFADIPPVIYSFITRFLPGSMTVILRKKKSVSDLITAGLPDVAVRIPANETALSLLSRFGPLTVTSANIHGEKTPGVIKGVQMLFRDEVKVYLDEGLLQGLPSTIVNLTGKQPVVVREGVIPEKDIMDAFHYE